MATADIAASAITSALLATGAVDSLQIADGAIATGDIANNATATVASAALTAISLSAFTPCSPTLGGGTSFYTGDVYSFNIAGRQ